MIIIFAIVIIAGLIIYVMDKVRARVLRKNKKN